MADNHSKTYNDNRVTKNFVSYFSDNYPLIGSVIGLFVAGIVAWTTLNLNVNANAESIQKVIVQQQKDETTFQQAAVVQSGQYSQIEADLQWIKAKLK